MPNEKNYNRKTNTFSGCGKQGLQKNGLHSAAMEFQCNSGTVGQKYIRITSQSGSVCVFCTGNYIFFTENCTYYATQVYRKQGAIDISERDKWNMWRLEEDALKNFAAT